MCIDHNDTFFLPHFIQSLFSNFSFKESHILPPSGEFHATSVDTYAPMIALIAGVYIGCLEVGDYRTLLICLHSVGNHEREGGRILVRFQMAGVVQIKFIIVVIRSVTNRADK